MFGIVPKTLWQKKIKPDELNRIPMSARAMLIIGNGKIILVDTGTGQKLNEKQKERLYESLKGLNYAVFKRFRTARFDIFEDKTFGKITIEVVGARKESYHHESRNPITEIGTLSDDLGRRDFTINAFAICLNSDSYGKLIDLHHGQSDLTNKILRTPLDPTITFSDDPLRMLRAARFASQLGFTIEEKTKAAMNINAERISIVSNERISQEFLKIMASTKPSVGLSILFETNLLESIMPELNKLHGVEQIDGKGHKDVFWHTLQVVDNVALTSENIWLRMAALLHDVGKPRTKRFQEDKGWTFHGHDAVGAKMAHGIFKRMCLPFEHLNYVQKLIRLHLRPIPLSKEEITDTAIRRLMVEAGEDIGDLMKLCKADVTSKNANKVRRVLDNFSRVETKIDEVEQKDLWAKWRPPINGNDIMQLFDIKEGKTVGRLKLLVENAILDGVIPHDRDAAIQFLKDNMNRTYLNN
ncbi:hypothetical protein CHS0354_000607 [Potamilus streckersoni]|uniref:tRNA nucleotidyltransferase n=1 Tax=Potamilus streckersoni TaxID=2493646 RepID=A0AAE0T850_9BIVA|nr:hypothetical protein CHS0354_000607 [Potamilus streckersoni]